MKKKNKDNLKTFITRIPMAGVKLLRQHRVTRNDKVYIRKKESTRKLLSDAV